MRQPGTTTAPGFDPMRWRLWFATLGAPTAWILHLTACYAWLGIVCVSDISRGLLAGVLIAVTLPLAGTAAAAGFGAWRLIGGGRGRSLLELAAQAPEGQAGMLGVIGLVLATIFVPLIVLETVPTLIAPICATSGAAP